MPRVKRGVTAHARHKKILDQAKGYRGRRKNVYRIAKEAVMKAGQYAYRDRRRRKRDFRVLWIARINAAARECGMTYSVFMNGLKKPVSRSIARFWLIWRFSINLPLVKWWKRLVPFCPPDVEIHPRGSPPGVFLFRDRPCKF